MEQTTVDMRPDDDTRVDMNAEVEEGPVEAPRFEDPSWEEPAPPTLAQAQEVARQARADAADALGGAEVATLEAEAAEGAAARAHLYAHDLRLGAARWLLTESIARQETAAAWIGLAALLELEARPGADVAARRALELLDAVEAPEAEGLSHRRLRASAWNNLGHARLRTGEPAGAVHAYRRATALFPLDPSYRVGLASSLDAAALPLVAYLHAMRARGLETLAQPELEQDMGTQTLARRWVTHLKAKLEQEMPFAPGVTLPGASSLQALVGMPFPAVGSRWMGLEVLEELAPLGRRMAPAPFRTHGADRVAQGPDCRVEGEALLLSCPGLPESTWFEGGPILYSAPRAFDPGTTCDNIVDRLLAPTPREYDVVPLVEGPEAFAAALMAKVAEEYKAVQASFREAGNLERCDTLRGTLEAWRATQETIDQGCACSCSNSEEAMECQRCWEGYTKACRDAFDIGNTLLGEEVARAQERDVWMMQNAERLAALAPPLFAWSLGKATCEGFCSTFVFNVLPSEVEMATVGGRLLPLLYAGHVDHVRTYLSCMAQRPRVCSPRYVMPGAPAEVLCVCAGIGPLEFCVSTDGTIEIKASALVSVGAKANLREGGSSLRLGVGVGLSANAGPVGLSVSQMAWWDASTDTWKNGDVSYDAGVSTPGGSVSACDAWEPDAAENEVAPEELVMEVRPGGP